MIARGVMGRGERVLGQQEKLDCRVCAWPVIAVVAIIAFACIAIFSDWPWKESPWTAAAAVATFCAAWVALWLGQSESRRIKAEKEEKANLIAAGLIIKLELASSRIAGARDHFSYDETEFPDATDVAKIVLTHMRSILDSIEITDLIFIHPLLPKAAKDLVSAIALIRSVAEVIEHVLPDLKDLNLSINADDVIIKGFLAIDGSLKVLQTQWEGSLKSIQTASEWHGSIWRDAYL